MMIMMEERPATCNLHPMDCFFVAMEKLTVKEAKGPRRETGKRTTETQGSRRDPTRVIKAGKLKSRQRRKTGHNGAIVTTKARREISSLLGW